MNLTEIHSTIKSGTTVYWQSLAYTVSIGKFDNELHIDGPNGHRIGCESNGRLINSVEADFFIKEESRTDGLRKITIQHNEFIGAQRPTTQEDNHAGITDRFDLYFPPSQLTNGMASDMQNGKLPKVGHFVTYHNGEYAVFHHGRIRYNISPTYVLINPL